MVFCFFVVIKVKNLPTTPSGFALGGFQSSITILVALPFQRDWRSDQVKWRCLFVKSGSNKLGAILR